MTTAGIWKRRDIAAKFAEIWNKGLNSFISRAYLLDLAFYAMSPIANPQLAPQVYRDTHLSMDARWRLAGDDSEFGFPISHWLETPET